MNTLPEKLYGAELLQYRCQVLSLYQSNALTPIQRACLLGLHGEANQLLQQTMDITKPAGDGEEIKTAFYLAVLRGHVAIVEMFLHWACFDSEHCLNKAKRMAKYMEHSDCLELLQNYVPPRFMRHFTKPLNDRKDRLIAKHKLHDVQKFFMTVNLHPVNVALNLQKHGLIGHLKELKKAFKLQLLVEMGKTLNRNEVQALKFFYYSLTISEIRNCEIPIHVAMSEEEFEDEVIRQFIRFVYATNFDGESYAHYFVHKFVKCFPFPNSALLQTVKQSLAEQQDSTTALWSLRNALNGGILKMKPAHMVCSCCESDAVTRTCDKCKSVQYCSELCETYHQFVHNRVCK